MRRIEQTTCFGKDFKRELKGKHRLFLNEVLVQLLVFLATDLPLPVTYKDHTLTGEWHRHRDCHLKPNLVLIYRLPDATTIQLVRLGSHSELDL